MCYFGKNPVWKFPSSITEDEDGNSVYHFTECDGSFERQYLIFIVIVHVYFLLEFILRLIIQKYLLKFLISVESFLEIFTTVPILIT